MIMNINGKDLQIEPGVSLIDVDLNGADLTGVNLTGVNLNGANLINTNLNGANLSDTNLANARLNYCIGDGIIIKNIPDLKWVITYTSDVMAIGSEQHYIDDWKSFTDDEIDKMHIDALMFWKAHKAQILEEIIIRTINGKDLRIGPGADLNGADLNGADLNGADLNGADLNGADLTGANLININLTGANLNGANLNGNDIAYCIGDGIIIKNIPDLTWHISYTKDVMAIGCEQHTIDQWKSFTDDEIDKIHTNALTFWNAHKSQILEEITSK